MWLARKWISTRLKESVQHEYDQRLEAYKSQLKAENEIHLLELKNKIEKESVLYRSAYSSFAEGQKATIERKLDSIEKLWNEIIRLDKNLPSTFAFIDILYVNEYQDAPRHKSFREWSENWSEEKSAVLSGDRNSAAFFGDKEAVALAGDSDESIARVRLYVGEYLWALFFSYRTIMARISLLLYWSLKKHDKVNWHKDTAIYQLLEAILTPHELAEFEKVDIGKISWLQKRLHSKILTASRKIISGEEFVAESLKQAELIQQRIPTFPINRIARVENDRIWP